MFTENALKSGVWWDIVVVLGGVPNELIVIHLGGEMLVGGKTRRLAGKLTYLAQKFSFWLRVPRNHP